MRFAILALLALAGCSTVSAPATNGPGLTRNTRAIVAFGCENGTSFTATFLVSPDAVELRFPDGTSFQLPNVVAASGARYADPRHEFWNKGDEAQYTVGRAMPTTCRVAK